MNRKLQKWVIVFALLSLCVLAIGSSLTPTYENSYLISYYGSISAGLPQMFNGSVLSQTFTFSGETAYISIPISKQDTAIASGEIRTALYDANDTLLYEGTDKVTETADDQDITIYRILPAGTYRLVLSFSGFPDGQWMNCYCSSGSDALGELTINGEKTDGLLYMKSAAKKEIYAVPWLAVAVLLALSVLLAWQRDKKLLLACLTGMAICGVLSGLSLLLHLHGHIRHAAVMLLEFIALVVSFLAFTTKPQRAAVREAMLSGWKKRKGEILRVATLIAGSAVLGAAAEAVTDDSFLWPKALFWAGATLVQGYHILFWKQLRRQMQCSFLVTGLVLGLLIGLAAPLTHSCWDEGSHYERLMRLSGGPVTYLSLADTTMIHSSATSSFSLAERQERETLLEERTAIFARKANRSAWLPEKVAYLPLLCGIWAGQILGLSFQNTFILGRCAALIFYLWVFYEAMKRLRGGKLLVYVFGLLPTLLFVEASYSYDGWVNALTVFGFCCFVGAMQRPEKYTVTGETVLMLAALVLGCMPKAIYTPIILLLLLVPKNKFADTRERKRYNRLVVAATALGVILYLIVFVMQGALSGTSDVRGGTDVSATEQLKSILGNPLQYAEILLTFLKSYLSPRNAYGYTTFFAYLGGIDLSVPALALLAAAALTDRARADRTLRRPGAMALSLVWLFALVCAVATCMYLAFTPVGLDTINGCQPRYLLPLLFPAWLLVGNFVTLPEKVRNASRCVIAPAMTLLSFVCVWSGVVGKITV